MIPATLSRLGLVIFALSLVLSGCQGNCPTCAGTGSVAPGSTGATGNTGTTTNSTDSNGTVEMK
jgi:hypothetical protein